MLMPPEVRNRRSALRSHFNLATQFKHLEESCIPSYVHSNALAAWVSWQRLVEAARLYTRYASPGDILDFGSATGEIAHLIARLGPYCFIEHQDIVVEALQKWLPDARRIDLDHIANKQFAAVFALDSLEHNEKVEPLVAKLEAALADSGVFILSGPTENLASAVRCSMIRWYATSMPLAAFTKSVGPMSSSFIRISASPGPSRAISSRI